MLRIWVYSFEKNATLFFLKKPSLVLLPDQISIRLQLVVDKEKIFQGKKVLI